MTNTSNFFFFIYKEKNKWYNCIEFEGVNMEKKELINLLENLNNDINAIRRSLWPRFKNV